MAVESFNSHNIYFCFYFQETLLLLAKLFKKCLPCLHSILLKQASLLYSDGDKNGQNCLFKVLPYATKPQKRSNRRPISVLPLRFGNSTRIINMQVIQTRTPVDLDEDKEKGDELETCRKTNFALPGKITAPKGGKLGKSKN